MPGLFRIALPLCSLHDTVHVAVRSAGIDVPAVLPSGQDFVEVRPRPFCREVQVNAILPGEDRQIFQESGRLARFRRIVHLEIGTDRV